VWVERGGGLIARWMVGCATRAAAPATAATGEEWRLGITVD
jgi:hypothetical protein